jgi:deoxyribonuclease V
VLDAPKIGCAKSLLIGKHGAVGRKRGEWAVLMDGKEIVGAALRTRYDCKPMYISQGHRVSLETAVQMTLAVDSGTRVPRPTREADRFVSAVKERGKES